MFPAVGGGYQASYAAAGSASALTSFTPTPQANGTTTLGWKTSQPASTDVTLGTRPKPLTTQARDTRAPRVRATGVLSLPDGTATITWTTNEKSDSRVVFGTRPKRLRQARRDNARVTSHTVVLTGLRPDHTYYFRVISKDAAGNRTTRPAQATHPHSFVSAAPGVAVHTAEQFRTGQQRGTNVLDTGFGALTMAKTRGTATYQSHILDAQQFVT
jgi:phosphodiesterase/alkaline phosphatase D-like protein